MERETETETERQRQMGAVAEKEKGLRELGRGAEGEVGSERKAFLSVIERRTRDRTTLKTVTDLSCPLPPGWLEASDACFRCRPTNQRTAQHSDKDFTRQFHT